MAYIKPKTITRQILEEVVKNGSFRAAYFNFKPSGLSDFFLRMKRININFSHSPITQRHYPIDQINYLEIKRLLGRNVGRRILYKGEHPRWEQLRNYTKTNWNLLKAVKKFFNL